MARALEYDANHDMNASLDACYQAVRERVAAGGEGWKPGHE
jgi:hypothetical protein